MKGLIRFLIKYHFLLLFIGLETISLAFVVQYNLYQKASFINFTQHISNTYYDKVAGAKEYWSLRETNKVLARENARLKNRMIDAFKSNQLVFKGVNDSIYLRHYEYIPAKVINNSVNKQHNYMTLNLGRINGIKEDMGVISPFGVVGIIKGVSDNFSTVLSVLNSHFNLSVKLKKNDYVGTLLWEGRDYTKASVKNIPHHVEIEIGDSIVTSAYSSIFPEGVLIGTVSHKKKEIQNFHELTIDLSTDFRNLSHVEVINNLMKEEQKKLEEETQND